MNDQLGNRFFVSEYTLLGITRFRIVDVQNPNDDARTGQNDFATREEADAVCAQRNAPKR